ncbi:hypothetical protein GCM10022221_28310 [Actinocorallia aurea]
MSAPDATRRAAPATLPGFPPGAAAGAAFGDQSWYRWHAPCDEIRSARTDRLAAVQELLAAALDAAPPGPLKAVSVCSGQARDLLPVLISHPRGQDVSARLIELEPLNASFLYGAVGSTALDRIEVVVADAGLTDAYAGAVPADLVLISGPFAHIGRPDTARTIGMLPRLCAPGATVVWSTYGPALADLAPLLESFTAAGFTEVSRASPPPEHRTDPTPFATGDPDLDGDLFDHAPFAAGAHRLTAAPSPSPPEPACSRSRSSPAPRVPRPPAKAFPCGAGIAGGPPPSGSLPFDVLQKVPGEDGPEVADGSAGIAPPEPVLREGRPHGARVDRKPEARDHIIAEVDPRAEVRGIVDHHRRGAGWAGETALVRDRQAGSAQKGEHQVGPEREAVGEPGQQETAVLIVGDLRRGQRGPEQPHGTGEAALGRENGFAARRRVHLRPVRAEPSQRLVDECVALPHPGQDAQLEEAQADRLRPRSAGFRGFRHALGDASRRSGVRADVARARIAPEVIRRCDGTRPPHRHGVQGRARKRSALPRRIRSRFSSVRKAASRTTRPTGRSPRG